MGGFKTVMSEVFGTISRHGGKMAGIGVQAVVGAGLALIGTACSKQAIEKGTRLFRLDGAKNIDDYWKKFNQM